MAEQFVIAAAKEAFRQREKRGVLLAATAAYLVISGALSALFIWINLASLRNLGGWYLNFYGGFMHATQNHEQPALASFTPPGEVFSMAPAGLVLALGFFILRAAYEATCLRWLVRGESSGLGLSLGADTWRVVVTYLLWFVVLLALVSACTGLIVGVFAGIHAVAVAGIGWAATLLAVLAPFVCLGAIGAVFYTIVRLAPAAAASISARRFAFFDAWKLSNGRVGPLLGAFLIVWVGYFIIQLLIRNIFFASASAIFMRALYSGQTPSLDELLAQLAAPTTLAMLGAGAIAYIIAQAMFALATFGINARAALGTRLSSQETIVATSD